VVAAGEVATTLRDRLPQPAPDERQVIRDYLLAVLAAIDDEVGGGIHVGVDDQIDGVDDEPAP
jgi:hypothetical protein